MVQKKVKVALLSVLASAFALIAAFGSVAKAQEATPTWETVNAIIEKGREDVNKEMKKDGKTYAFLEWNSGSPNQSGGEVLCMMTDNATIKQVKEDIVEVLVNALRDNYKTVSSIECTKAMNNADPGTYGKLALSDQVKDSDVVLFAKACLGNSYEPGQGILSLARSSFTVRCNAADGTKTSYTMTFVDSTQTEPEKMEPNHFSQSVVGEATMGVINTLLGSDGSVDASNPDDSGNVKVTVTVKNAQATASSIGENVIGSILMAAEDHGATKASCALLPNKDLTLSSDTQTSAINEWVDKCLEKLLTSDTPKTLSNEASATAKDLDAKTLDIKITLASTKTVTYTFTFDAKGATAPQESVIVEKASNGTVSVSDTYAKAKDTVKVTPKANAGYEVNQVTVTDVNNRAITVKANADGTYTFQMPEAASHPVTVSVTFKKIETIAVYRLYNQYAKTHLYTSDLDEKAALIDAGWTPDNNGNPLWYAPKVKGTNDTTIYRFFNPYTDDHYFCPATDTDQIAQLKASGWKQDSAASNLISAAKATGEPVYTLFNKYNQVDTHLYTSDETERATRLGEDGWEEHDTVIYAVPATES